IRSKVPASSCSKRSMAIISPLSACRCCHCLQHFAISEPSMAENGMKAFVCGHPIRHSRSPKIHGFWLKEHGIAGSYEAVDVAPEDFGSFLAGLAQNGFRGGNVTIPHKEAAFRLTERRDEAAEA